MTDAPTFQPTPGLAMHRLMTDLYPICRSITGDGVRETLRILQQHIPLTMHEVPSGTQVFDWTVPDEWNIRDAYVMDSDGKRVIDFQQHNLHILNYSIPFRGKMTLDELMPHLHTAPNKPDAIPYRTSYYAPNWGFCLSHYQLLQMGAGEYEVVVDSTLEPGSLTYGEYVIPGETDAEVLITTHVCHPSMCNDNLSGIVTSVWLAKTLAQTMPRYTYRFLYIPATIGSITWLALNRYHVPRIAHGLTVTNMGDNGAFTYKRRGRATTRLTEFRYRCCATTAWRTTSSISRRMAMTSASSIRLRSVCLSVAYRVRPTISIPNTTHRRIISASCVRKISKPRMTRCARSLRRWRAIDATTA
jgi:aminopeptidase-like protein